MHGRVIGEILLAIMLAGYWLQTVLTYNVIVTLTFSFFKTEINLAHLYSMTNARLNFKGLGLNG